MMELLCTEKKESSPNYESYHIVYAMHDMLFGHP